MIQLRNRSLFHIAIHHKTSACTYNVVILLCKCGEKVKKDYLRLGTYLILLLVIFYIFQQKQIAKESITYFPIDYSVSFPKAETKIVLENQKNNQYSVLFETSSHINKQAYLRQNMSLLYANGKLVSSMGGWKQNVMELSETKTVVEKESSLFEAISFHYAEIHDDNDNIFSSQKISHDQLYVINSKYDQNPIAFKTPEDSPEIEWKKVLDTQINNTQNFYYHEALKKYNINEKEYFLILGLTDLKDYNDTPFPNYTKEQSDKIIGQLTEGLYKNYFLGILKNDGTMVDPIGSTIPIILIGSDHLLVLFTTADGDAIMLRQQISNL